MSILVKLPSVLFSSIATEWLMTSEFAAVDTAYCNKILRPLLLEEIRLLHQIKEITTRKEVSRLPVSMYKWVFIRGIKLQNYFITEAHIRNGKLLYDANFEHIKLVSFRTLQPESAVSDFINKCVNIDKISCSDGAIVLKLNESVLNRISVISVHKSSSYLSMMKMINKHCKNLTLFNDTGGSNDGQMKLLLQNNPKLKILQCTGSMALLHYIIDNRCRINDLDFDVSGEDIDMSILKKIFANNTNSVTSINNDEGFVSTLISHHGQKKFYINFEEHVHEFQIHNNSIFTNHDEQDVIEVLSGVTDLNLLNTMNNGFTDNFLNFIVTHLSYIKVLRLLVTRMSTEMLKELITKCKSLTKLTLTDIDKEIGTLFDNVTIPPSLQIIELGARRIGLKTTVLIMKQCPTLQSFRCGTVYIKDVREKDMEDAFKKLKIPEIWLKTEWDRVSKEVHYAGERLIVKNDTSDNFDY